MLTLRKLLRQIVSQLKYLRKLLIFETSLPLYFSRYRMNDKIFKSCQIPENLKLADISSAFKKDDTNLAKNCRSVSVLPTLSNGFWKKLQVVDPVNIFLSLSVWWHKRVQYLMGSFIITRKVGKDQVLWWSINGSFKDILYSWLRSFDRKAMSIGLVKIP